MRGTGGGETKSGVRAWALFGVQPDSSGDHGEVFRLFGASFSCYKIPLVRASHQPPGGGTAG